VSDTRSCGASGAFLDPVSCPLVLDALVDYERELRRHRREVPRLAAVVKDAARPAARAFRAELEARASANGSGVVSVAEAGASSEAMLTTREVAARLEVTDSRVHQLIRDEGLLAGELRGGRWYVRAGALPAYEERQR
jgi:hypothetical protein